MDLADKESIDKLFAEEKFDKVPYSEDDEVDNPVSLYAVSKKSIKFSPT